MFLLLLALACTGSDTDTDVQAEFLGIGLTPADPRLSTGDVVQFTAKAFYDDYTSSDVSADTSWVSTDPHVATVDGTGLATAVAVGEASVVATYGDGVSARVGLTVTSAAVTGVDLIPSSLTLNEGDSAQLVAHASFADGTEGNIAGSCTWTSDDGGVAQVDASGAVDGLRPGTTAVHATYQDLEITPVAVEVVPEDDPVPLADLRVTSFDAIADMDEVLYEVEVSNRGTGYAGGFYLHLILDASREPSPEDDMDGLGWVPGLAAGERTSTLIDVSPVSPGTYSSWVLADPDGWVEEEDESDNASGPLTVEVEEPTGAADLAVYSFAGLSDGTWTAYWIEVVNLGTADAGPFWVDLFYDEVTDPVVGDLGDDFAYVDGLAAGDSWGWEPEVSGGPSTEWWSWVLVDSNDDVPEQDESNNLDLTEVVPE